RREASRRHRRAHLRDRGFDDVKRSGGSGRAPRRRLWRQRHREDTGDRPQDERALHQSCEALPCRSAVIFLISLTPLLTMMSIRSLPISFVDGRGSPVTPLFTRGRALGSAAPRPPPPRPAAGGPAWPAAIAACRAIRASRAAFHCSGVWPVGSKA